MGIHDDANFSPDRSYRYTLRRWIVPRTPEGLKRRTLNFIGLNPSTADESRNDPTVRRCMGFAESWGFAELIVTNAFALRSTDPSLLKLVADPVGPDNDYWLAHVMDAADLVIIAWSGMAVLKDRHAGILARMAHNGVHPHVLGLTKYGYPRHPLYMRASAKPARFA